MAVNDRVEYLSGDIAYSQLAPSQSSRTEFVAGKTSESGDAINYLDFRIPTGTPAFDGEATGPVRIERSRVVKLGRNIVSDQTIPAPQAGVDKTTTIDSDGTWGTAYDPSHTITPTETQDVNGSQGRSTGYDSILSA